MKASCPDLQIEEILLLPPAKLIRLSTLFVALGIIVLFVTGAVVRISDETAGTVQVTNNHAYVNIYPGSGGSISKLFVGDKQTVKCGDLLAIVENPVDNLEYLALCKTTESLRKSFFENDTLALINAKFPELEGLGNLQTAWSGLQIGLQQLGAKFRSNEFQSQMKTNKETQKIYQSLALRLDEQQKLLEVSLATKNKDLERNKFLHQSGLIADAEMERIETGVLAEQMGLEKLKAQVIENELMDHNTGKELEELGWHHRNELDQSYLDLKTTFETLTGQIQLWEEKYLMRSPVSGMVQFTGFWEEQQQVSAGQVVMTILPINDRQVSAKMLCAAAGAATVSPGQAVMIELSGYPAITDGYIRGEVQGISEVPVDGNYTVDISLTEGFTTNLGKTINFNRYAEGKGKIITGQESFLLHLFKNILAGK